MSCRVSRSVPSLFAVTRPLAGPLFIPINPSTLCMTEETQQRYYMCVPKQSLNQSTSNCDKVGDTVLLVVSCGAQDVMEVGGPYMIRHAFLQLAATSHFSCMSQQGSACGSSPLEPYSVLPPLCRNTQIKSPIS